MDIDRREHLRIPDSVFVEYRVVDRKQAFSDDPPPPYEVSPRFLLLRELSRIELEAQQLLRALTRADDRLGAFLGTVSRRLDMMAKILSAEELSTEARPADDVSLCEGGISFRVAEFLQEGTLLGLKLLFTPSMLGLIMFGEVRYSRLSEESDRYVIGVQFLHRDPLSDELLARHIIHLQAEARRARLAEQGFDDSDPV